MTVAIAICCECEKFLRAEEWPDSGKPWEITHGICEACHARTPWRDAKVTLAIFGGLAVALCVAVAWRMAT